MRCSGNHYIYNVKGFLKYILLVFAVPLLLSSALELDNKERKQNYENENHSFICSAIETYQFTYLEVAPDLPAFDIFCWSSEQVVLQKTYNWLSTTEPDPPGRLYLRNSVFLI